MTIIAYAISQSSPLHIDSSALALLAIVSYLCLSGTLRPTSPLASLPCSCFGTAPGQRMWYNFHVLARFESGTLLPVAVYLWPRLAEG